MKVILIKMMGKVRQNKKIIVAHDGTDITTFSSLPEQKEVRKKIKNTDDTEMMWVYFTQSGLFKLSVLQDVPSIFKRSEIRMTLDYEDDLRFFKKIIGHFSNKKDNFNLKDAIEFLDKNPDVIKINQYLQERFLDNQKSKTKLLLKGNSK